MSRSAVDQTLAAAGIQFAYLFGSRATGRHRPTSDDVGVHEALAAGLPDLDAFATSVARVAT